MVRAGQVDTEPSAAARTVPLGGPHRSDGPLLTPLECVSILKENIVRLIRDRYGTIPTVYIREKIEKVMTVFIF
jgi:hypothetical protein